MRHHRFADLLEPTTPESGFVPCPFLGWFGWQHPTQVISVYQLAAARTREQLASWSKPSRRKWPAAFSSN